MDKDERLCVFLASRDDPSILGIKVALRYPTLAVEERDPLSEMDGLSSMSRKTPLLYSGMKVAAFGESLGPHEVVGAPIALGVVVKGS